MAFYSYLLHIPRSSKLCLKSTVTSYLFRFLVFYNMLLAPHMKSILTDPVTLGVVINVVLLKRLHELSSTILSHMKSYTFIL